MSTVCRAPPARNVFRARSTRAATSQISGATESVPASMRPTSSRTADEAAHVVGLLVDDPEELAHLRPVQVLRRLQQRGGRALDGGERRAQLVAHKPEELHAQPVELVERREILHRDHHRLDRAVEGGNRRRVERRGDAATVRDRELDLLHAHRLAGSKCERERDLAERHLAPVGAPADHDLQQLRRGLAGRAQGLDEPPRLAVERHRPAAARVEHHHPDRRGLDQRLEIGPRAALVTVRAGVGDGGARLGGEQHENLLVRPR